MIRRLLGTGLWAAWAGVVLLAPPASAQLVRPFELVDQPESVYAPPSAPSPEEGINAGGVNFSLDISYLSHYVYRGIDQTTPPFRHSEHALQFDSKLEFNLGKVPHPFIGVFSNVFNQDPVSRFEEVRPYAGLDWFLKPLTVSVGYNSYLFPSRQPLDTQEVWGRFSLDDSGIFHTERPVLAPYAYVAYDFELYEGIYAELGVKHDIVFPDFGLTLSVIGDVAYVAHNPYFATVVGGRETGFQHYDVGLIGTYALNAPLKLPRRYGTWDLKGYLYYTDGIASHLRADTRLWGGVGISFNY